MPDFKVMTWNLENLYLAGNGFGPKTREDYDRKSGALSEVVIKLAPDVLAVQEVGDPEAFEEWAGKLQGSYPHRALSIFPDARGIRVGFLSKLKIKEHEDFRDFPEAGLPTVPGWDSQGNLVEVGKFGRGALRILVEAKPGLPVHLINVHLKSKLLTYPSRSGGPRFSPRNENERVQAAGLALLKRAAEASALRVKVNQFLEGNAGTAMIVMGDLNDVTDAATTQILNGPTGSEIGSRGFKRSDKGDDTRLFNLASLIPQERRFSRVHAGNAELIDHILVSQELLPGQPRRLPIVDSHVNLLDGLPSITDNPADRQGEPGSDHAPLTAVFQF